MKQEEFALDVKITNLFRYFYKTVLYRIITGLIQ